MKTKSTFLMSITKKVLILLIVFLFSILKTNAQYCLASGSGCDDYINHVEFGYINTWSGCNSYYDFSYYSTDIVKGNTYPINVSNANQFSNDTCEVWIDWDKDYIFDNTTEYYQLTNSLNYYSGNILVPLSASTGQTKMRIRIRRGGIINPCGNASQLYGEVEDYTVNVISPVPMVVNYINFYQNSGSTSANKTGHAISRININVSGNTSFLYLKNLYYNTFNSIGNFISNYVYYKGSDPNPGNSFGSFGYMAIQNGSQIQYIDSFPLQNGDNYFWLAYDISSNPTIGAQMKAVLDSLRINDSTYITNLPEPLSYIEVSTPLNGNYTINQQGNGNYLSFTQAVNNLVDRGVSGPVVFNVDSGYYNEQIFIPEIFGASATNTITFQSSNNSYSSVLLEYNTTDPNYYYTLKLNNASFISFKNLTLSSGLGYNSSRVILIDNFCQNVSFTGNRILGTQPSYSSETNALLNISYSGQVDNLLINNNIFENGGHGIFFQNYGYTSNNNIINNNKFFNQSAFGIYTIKQSNVIISNNTINSFSAGSDYYGINLDNLSGNVLIEKNRISLGNKNYCFGIYIYYPLDSLINKVICNNFISINTTNNSQTDGIDFNNVNGFKVFNNSLNIIGNNYSSQCIRIYNSRNLILKNNSFSNTALGQVYYSDDCPLCQSDFNNLYSNNRIAVLNGTNIIGNFSLWKTTTYQDTNSVNALPFYISDTNLHTSNAALNGKAIPLAEVSSDIDNEARNSTSPDIGADEFTPPPYDLQLDGFVNLPNGCGLTNNENIKIIIKNAGSANFIANNATVKFALDLSQQLVSESINRNIASGDTIQYTFGIGANLSVNTFLTDSTFQIKSWLEFASDNNHLNDSIFSSILSKYLPNPPLVTDTTIVYGTSVSLNAQVDQSYIPKWYDEFINGNLLRIGNPFVSPVLYTADTFYVAAKKGGYGYVTLGNETSTSGYPFYTYFHDSKTQMLYTAQELQNMGLSTGPIYSISFNVSYRATQPMYGFNIQMKSINQSTLSEFITSGFTNVYSGTYVVPGTGWQEIIFQQPFIWDGVSNILVNLCFDNSSYTSNSNVYSSFKSGMTIHKHADGSFGCAFTGGSSQTYRPNVKFKGLMMGNTCESNRVPLKVNVSNTPSKDIGVTAVSSPNSGFEMFYPLSVNVSIKNFGSSAIDTFYVSYKLNNNTAVTEMIVGNLFPGSTLNYTFNQLANFTTLGTQTFKVFTNLLADTVRLNDTTIRSIDNYTYCQPTFSYGCYYTSINSFALGTINNSNSGCNNDPGGFTIYPDTLFTTTLQKNVNYPFSVLPTNNGYSVGYAIWIDLNHDGDFNDLDECVYYSYNTQSNQLNGSIYISSNYSFTGKTRMRVRALRYSYLQTTQSCSNITEYGETEDYFVTILPPPLQKDLKLLQIIKPDAVTYQLVNTNVIVKVKNIGLDTITQIPLSYKFNNQSDVPYSWNGQLLPQQELDITIGQITANTANNSIKIYSSLVGDLDNSNDTLSANYIALPAPALIGLSPDTIHGNLASCDSTASQTQSFNIINQGHLPLTYKIYQSNGFYEDFENGISKWILSGSWGLIVNQGYNSGTGLTESPIGNYGDGWNYFAQLRDSMFITNKDSSYLSYMLKFSVESCCDRLYTQISVNGGSWINLADHGNLGTQVWTLHKVPFSTYVNIGDYIKVRFLFTSDGSAVSDGVVLDNIYINGIENGSWAMLNKIADTVAVGNTSLVNITMTVGQLNAGNYFQNLVILSNDPTRPYVTLPVYLNLVGYPQILVKDSVKVFPSIMAGAITTEYLKIYNTGCDSLKITSINHSNPAFSLNYNSFILPKDSGVVSVTFNSLAQGVHYDTLVVLSNSSYKKFYISGTILPTPQLVYHPDSINASTNNCNDTIYKSLTIINNGNTTLNWNAIYSKGAENALSFNGSNSEVQFGNLGNIPDQGTIEFWMRTGNNSGNTKLIFSTSGNTSGWKGINIWHSNSYLYLLIGDDNGNYYGSYQISSNISTNVWHHIAITWDKTTNYGINTYFDGNQVQTNNYNTYWPSVLNDVRLGAGYSNSSYYYFDGEIDELRFWKEKRSLADIKNNMNDALLMPNPNLMGLWGFNENSGNTVYNFYNNLYNGSLLNVNRVVSGAKIFNPGIEVFPPDGVLAAGDSIITDVIFRTNGLNSGIHNSGIGITTNDPLHPLEIVYTKLNISGSALFSVASNNIQIDSIMAGATVSDSVYIKNTGCDTLKFNNFYNNNSAFSINFYSSNLIILPNDSAKLKITFNPINVGTYYDTITFNTNIGDYYLNIIGVGMAAPIASVNPTSIIDSITLCNQSKTRQFKIINTGNEVLTWNCLMGGVGVSDNFNSGIDSSNWTETSGGIAAASCGTAINSSNALYFNGYGTRQAVTKTLNTIGGGNISYYIKISGSGGSPCEQADNGEDVVLEYTTDNGNTWNILQTLYTGNYSVFTLVQLPIPYAAQNFNTKFRWRQLSHSGSCCDHWSLDEVSISILNTANATPSSGNVAINDSTDVTVVLSGSGLINGIYNSQLLINTNDPLHSQITIPVQMIVKANPIISISTNPLIMDTMMIGALNNKSLYIKNIGCDTLKITNIIKTLSEFNINTTSLNIPPRDSGLINVSFISNLVGEFTDSLILYSNISNQSVIIKGKTIGAPQIITLPNLIAANFSCDSQIITPFKIKNPGIVALNWNAYIDNQEKGALQFNGIGNYVNIIHNNLSNTNWTVEAWVKPADLSLGNRLIAGSVRNCNEWGLYMVNGKFAVIYSSAIYGCSRTLVSTNTLSINTWYHVACTYNGSVIRLYINGQLVNSVLENIIYNGSPWAFIGGDPDYGRYFSGSIDEVRIWNFARTQSQIYFAMNHMLNGNETGLKGYWPFNKIVGGYVKDFSGNNINGIISGTTFTSNESPVNGNIELSNYSGNIGVGDSTIINLNINRHMLSQGLHTYKLIVHSDDPINPYDTTLANISVNYNLIPVDIGSDSTVCSGNIISLNAGNFANYLWNNNSTSQILNVNTGGTYYVNVTDFNGCNYSDSVHINITQSPTADAGLDKSICQGGYISLNGNALSGTYPYQYKWRNSSDVIVSNGANFSFYPPQSDVYTLSVTDNNGCSSILRDTALVTVYQKPTVNAGNDTIIDLGTTVVLNGNITGGTYPYTVSWSTSASLSAYNILNPTVTPNYTYGYSLFVSDANNCTGNDYMQIIVRFTISGQVVYNNSALTPMPFSKVFLSNNTTILDSVTADNNGYYFFSKVGSGSYYLTAKPYTTFGGINSTDALGIRRHIVNIAPIAGVNMVAADVNLSNTISSADALLVLRKTVGLITNFTGGDWASEKKQINLYYSNAINQNIKVLSMGDINGSYTPFATKSTEFIPELKCGNGEKQLIIGQEFELPILYKQNFKLGAVTLYLKYPENLIDITDVQSFGNSIEYQVSNGVLSVGFYNESGFNLEENKLFTIKCKVKSNVTPDILNFALVNQSEIADINGKTLSGIILEIPCLSLSDSKNEFVLEDIYPNPFSNTSHIRLYSPEIATVELSILNILGEKIKSFEIQKSTIGWNEITIEASDLPEGIYMYRIQAITPEKRFDQTGRMMIIR